MLPNPNFFLSINFQKKKNLLLAISSSLDNGVSMTSKRRENKSLVSLLCFSLLIEKRIKLDQVDPSNPHKSVKVWNCDVSVHGRVKGGLKSNIVVTSAREANCFTFETLVRSTGVHMKCVALKSLSFTFRLRKHLKSAKMSIGSNTLIGQTFLPLCGLSASLCVKINSPADVTDQTSTQSPVISTVN